MPYNVYLDTNILLDYILDNRPAHHSAVAVMEACRDNIVNGWVSAQSFCDAFYIMRKDFNPRERKQFLQSICVFLEIVAVDELKIEEALTDDNFVDMEDCVQYLCAQAAEVNFIITNNLRDFKHSDIPVLSPDAFVRQYLPA